jgi:hypothetical protein
MTHPIARLMGPTGEPDPQGARRAARLFWQAHGGVAFTAEQLREMGGLDRQFLEAAAAKHYGKRSAK